MKKQLYGTTFLVALGLSITPAAAGMDPIHLELGGSFKQNFGFGEQDLGTSTANEVSYQNNEVHFKMRGELDNGLVIGGAIELEAESTGDQIDQHYVTLRIETRPSLSRSAASATNASTKNSGNTVS